MTNILGFRGVYHQQSPAHLFPNHPMLNYQLKNASKFAAEAGKLGIEVLGNRTEKLVGFIIWSAGYRHQRML